MSSTSRLRPKICQKQHAVYIPRPRGATSAVCRKCCAVHESAPDTTLQLQMHGMAGLHSARAISRQRQLRALQRAGDRNRRLSSRTDSTDSMDRPHKLPTLASLPEHRVGASIGMFHVGICFVALGLFFIASGLLPDDVLTWRSVGWWNELVSTGLFVAILGILLIVLNRAVAKREEDDLNDYVQKQLTRSRSGHRLERDVETGCLTTKHHRRFIEKMRENRQNAQEENVHVHSPLVKVAPDNVLQNNEVVLEKIVEEEVFERGGGQINLELIEAENRETISTTTTASLSPRTPSETRELISN